MVYLQKLMAHRKDYQLTIRSYSFPELLSSFHANNPIEAAIQDAYGQLSLKNDGFENPYPGAKTPECRPPYVQVLTDLPVADVISDEFIDAGVDQL
jgi:hypothetical protein